MADQFLIVDLGGQRWPVVRISEHMLGPEDKVGLPMHDYSFPVLAVEKNEMLVLVVFPRIRGRSNTYQILGH
jgi:hypothetical protein